MEGNKITYHQQVSFCGKARCRRCREGIGHGPYWYAYQTVNGRTVRTYVGKDAPAEVLAVSQAEAGASQEFANTQLRLYVLGQFRLEQRVETPPPPSPTPRTSRSSTSNAAPQQGNGSPKTRAAAHLLNAAQAPQWEPVTDASLQHQRVRSLLSCLVSSPGRKLAREQVMYTLWPDLDMDTASHRLDRAVHSLRQAFEPGRSRPATSKLLLTEHATLALADQSQFWIDADAFEQLISRARAVQESDPGQAEQLLEEASLLYNGDFLPDEKADDEPDGRTQELSGRVSIGWVTSRRESLRRSWISLLLELADLRIAREAIPGAIDILDRLLSAEPANEAAVQRLMALLAQMGRRGEAIQAYQRFAQVLKQDYKIAPLPETRTLYENVLHGRAVLAPRAPGRGSSNGTTARNVPALSAPNGARPADTSYSSASIPAVLPAHMHIGRTQQSPLVGREEEMKRLYELLQITQQTRSLKLAGQKKSSLLTPMDLNMPRQQQCVMLMGDVGIGKTRLAEETAREAKRRNWAVAWCRAYVQESSVPYRLWTETLRKAMSQGLWQRQEVTKRPLVYQPLRALLPELADLMPPIPQPQMQPPPEQEQLRLWESTRSLLSTICENTTLLIVLDDLQWADSSSCELLTYLVRQMRGQPVMFLCTCRDTELPNGHPLRSLLTDLQREQAVEQIPVKPLSPTEIGQIISHLPEPVIETVSKNASGNPFFAEELARGLTASAIDVTFDPANPNQLPDTIQAVLDLRLARISQECQRLLERGSVLGGEFSFETIRDMASSGAYADEDQILDLLEEALQARMITEEGAGMNIIYHLWHPLLQTYLYDRLSAARKASLHRKAAQVLQTYYAGREAEYAAEIADHLVKGGATPALTARFAELAADRAYSLSAYRDVEKYYRLALEHMSKLSPNASQEELLHHAYILERLGESSMIVGKYEDALKFYERVLEIRSKQILSSEEKKDEAQIEALIWCEIGQVWRYLGNKEKVKESFERGEYLLTNANIIGGPAWARIRYQQGHTYWILEGNLNVALSTAEEALAIVESKSFPQQQSNDPLPLTLTRRILRGDPMNLGRMYLLVGTIEVASGKNTNAASHLKTALAIFEQHDYLRELAIVCSNLGDLYLKKAEYELARNVFERALNIDEKIGDKPSISVILNNLGILAARLGNLTEAENWNRQALVMTEQVNDLFYMSLFCCFIATFLIEQGKFEEAKPLLVRALKISRSRHITPCIGFAIITLGQLHLARALSSKKQIKGYSIRSTEQTKKTFEHFLFKARNSFKYALTFDGLEADTILDGKLSMAKIQFLLGENKDAYNNTLKLLKSAIDSELVWLEGRAQSLLGEILTASSQLDEAENCFKQALFIFRKTNMKLDYARTQQAYALSLFQKSKSATVHEQVLKYLDEAYQVFKECHALLDQQKIEKILISLNSKGALKVANDLKLHK